MKHVQKLPALVVEPIVGYKVMPIWVALGFEIAVAYLYSI